MNERDFGFTLVEVLVAMVIVTTVALGVAQMVTIAVAAAQDARARTACTVLAIQKMEQLKTLTWGFAADEILAPRVSDRATDLSYDPPRAGGPGLATSPAGSLDRNTPGYVDFLDGQGRWVGTGSTPPAAAVFARRWSVAPLPADPEDTLLFQVFVTRTVTEARVAAAIGSGPRLSLQGDVLLSTVSTRRQP